MTEKQKVNEKDILAVIIIISIIVLGYFIYTNFLPKPLFKEKPISIEAIEISGPDNLFDVSQLLSAIASNGVNVNKKIVEYDSKEAGDLIEKYNLKSIPALIVISKDLGKISIDTQTFAIDGNTAIFDRGVPYIDLETKETRGLVELKEVYDSACADCSSLSQFQKSFESFEINIQNYEAIESDSDSGKDLISQNNLNYLPSLLISKNIKEYWWIFPRLEQSMIETDDYYILKDPVPPYKDLSTGKTKGKVSITYLTDKTCEDCYDITQLEPSFQSLGIFISDKKTFDISSSQGKSLIKTYNITKVPTIIISKELSADYPQLKEILESIGTFESDGSFVFRELDKVNAKYKNL